MEWTQDHLDWGGARRLAPRNAYHHTISVRHTVSPARGPKDTLLSVPNMQISFDRWLCCLDVGYIRPRLQLSRDAAA